MCFQDWEASMQPLLRTAYQTGLTRIYQYVCRQLYLEFICRFQNTIYRQWLNSLQKKQCHLLHTCAGHILWYKRTYKIYSSFCCCFPFLSAKERTQDHPIWIPFPVSYIMLALHSEAVCRTSVSESCDSKLIFTHALVQNSISEYSKKSHNALGLHC